MYSGLKGIMAFDTLGDPDGFRGELEEFASHVGLPIASTRKVGLEGLKGLITEAIQRLSS